MSSIKALMKAFEVETFCTHYNAFDEGLTIILYLGCLTCSHSSLFLPRPSESVM